jgi:hypothetical protein
MRRDLIGSVIATLICAAQLTAQDPSRGKIKSVDADKGTIKITVADKDVEFAVTEKTRFMDAGGQPIKDRLKDGALKEGVPVMYRAEEKDGKLVLVGLKLVGENKQLKPDQFDSSKLKPLTEMGKDDYKGSPGGLYPDGKNERPTPHEKAGIALAGKIEPLNGDGKSDPDGKIVLLSVGMSNTTQEFSMFRRLADADRENNPKVMLVDGAQGGMTAARIQDPDSKNGGETFWKTVDDRLKRAGATRAQVQVVWIKEADAGPTAEFPKYPQTLQAELAKIVQLLPDRFPNIKQVYLSSRIYGGYATTRLNPEPYAYESGFAVKWLIEQQLKGDKSLNYDPDKGKVAAPWLSWGPYLWANGTAKRADGLTYEESDFSNDGTHPSEAGRKKVAEQLLQFFKNDTTCKPWFVKN